MKFEVGKTYKTRGGSEARVYATDGKDNYPVHGAMNNGDGWEYAGWTSKGGWFDDDNTRCSKHDLIPEKRRRLKTVAELMAEYWIFDKDGALVNSAILCVVINTDLHKLGGPVLGAMWNSAVITEEE